MDKRQLHKIAVIDDDKLMLTIVSEILEEEGYNTCTFSSVTEAEEFLEKNEFSLLLLDVSMPVEDGYSFLKRLKDQSRYSDLPVIFMTGKGDINDKVRGFELGAVDYIVKPFHRMDILMRVKAHIRIVEDKSSDKEKLNQLKKAHMSMMPQPEDLPNARFGVHFNSLLEAGGDFYEVIEIDSERTAYFIADISGHDIATSYVMPAVKALMKQCFKDSDSFQAELESFNKSVKESIPSGKFITAILVILNRTENGMKIINMGHVPPVLIRKTGEVDILEIEGDILGVHENPQFGTLEIKVDSQDRLVLLTDGLLEDPARRKIWTSSLNDLIDTVHKNRNVSYKNLPDRLAEGMNVSAPTDDVLILAIEV